MDGTSGSVDDAIDRRVTAVLAIAAQFQTEVALSELAALLPADVPTDANELAQWVRDHPASALLDGERVRTPATVSPPADELRDRRARGLDFLEAARELFSGPLAPLAPIVRCACVTGSTAYQEPAAGDDVDLMVVTAPGTMWYAILRVFLTLRHARRQGKSRARPWCLNYVLDEREANRAYLESRGFLFAREALTAQPVSGARYYAALIQRSAWMQVELPRMYRRWITEPIPAPVATAVPFGLRIANAAAFPLVATYLQLVGLRHNSRLRRGGRADEGFRTITRPRQYALQTLKFDRLHGLIEPAGRTVHREQAA